MWISLIDFNNWSDKHHMTKSTSSFNILLNLFRVCLFPIACFSHSRRMRDRNSNTDRETDRWSPTQTRPTYRHTNWHAYSNTHRDPHTPTQMKTDSNQAHIDIESHEGQDKKDIRLNVKRVNCHCGTRNFFFILYLCYFSRLSEGLFLFWRS